VVAGGVAAVLGGRQEPVDFRRHQIVAFEHRTVYCWRVGGPMLSNGCGPREDEHGTEGVNLSYVR